MKRETEYLLDGSGVDAAADAISVWAKQIGIERRNALRIRLTMEELLRISRHSGMTQRGTLRLWKRFGRPCIRFRYRGEAYNPMDTPGDDFSEWTGKLLSVYIFASLTLQFWETGPDILLRLWKPLAVCIGLNLVFFAVKIAVTSFRLKVGAGGLIRKNLPAMLVGYATASSPSAFAFVRRPARKNWASPRSRPTSASPSATSCTPPATVCSLPSSPITRRRPTAPRWVWSGWAPAGS